MTIKKTSDEIVNTRNQDLFQDLVETSQDLIWQCDAEGRYTYLNPAWETTFGYKIEEMLGKKFSDFQTTEMALRDTEEFKRLMRGNLVKGLETIHIGKEGQEIHLVFNAKFIQNENGEIVGTRGTAHDITERKRAEETLRKSEKRFRMQYYYLPVPTFTWQSKENDFELVEYNLAGDTLTKGTVARLLGIKASVFFKDYEGVLGDMLDCFRDKKANTREIEYTYKLINETHNLRFTYVFVEPDLIMVHSENITELVRAGHALRESEEKYRLLHENAGIGIGYYKPDGTVLSYNRLAASHMGGVPEAFVGKSIFELFPKQEAEFYHARITKACSADGPMVYEDMVPLPLGNKFFLSTFTKITNAKNNILGIQIISQDITELKQAEFKRSESESQFRSVFEQSPVGSVFVGLDKRFVKCNPAFCAFLGYDENELIGKAIADITFPADADVGMKELKLIAEGKLDSFSVQKRYVRKDGAVVWGEVSISLVRDATGKPLYFLPVIMDITDRKKAEDEHRKYEQQIQQSQKLESLGLLAGGIAHDFNNLLGGIYGYIDMAREFSQDKSVSQYLSKTINTIDRARALTQQLLTFAKGGAPIQKIAPLFPFVQEAAQFALAGSNVSCSFDIPEDIWNCNYDRNQIGQVIDNLLINAQQAMPLGGTVKVFARNVSFSEKEHPLLAKGDYISISVQDTGIGIPKNLITKIFDPFFTTKAKGHGLGLATSYSIVNRHGGCIDVYSEQGKGSIFHVYLPAAAEPISLDTPHIEATHKGKGTIIVMDDEIVMRDIIGDMLTAFGYSPKCTNNGTEALELLDNEIKAGRPIAGMILDLTVPGAMGGKEAIAEIRKIDPRIPVIVASGYADDPVMQNPAEYGFTASLCKPFMRKELAKTLSQYLTPAGRHSAISGM